MTVRDQFYVLQVHFNRQWQMIRQVRPGLVPEDFRIVATGIAQVDPVQAQQWKTRRVGFCRTAMVAFEGFVQVVAAGEGGVALQLPVVEVPGDDHRSLQRPADVAQRHGLADLAPLILALLHSLV